MKTTTSQTQPKKRPGKVDSSLKTLEEHNKEKEWQFEVCQSDAPFPNGIACPKCGHETMDSDKEILSSLPPQKKIHCPRCDFQGFRLY